MTSETPTTAAAAAVESAPAAPVAAPVEAPQAAPAAPATPPAPAEEAPKPVPTEDVDLDLDTLEREDTKGPFRVRHAGRLYTFTDPREVDFKVLFEVLSNPVTWMKECLPEDDFNTIIQTVLPSWKLEAMLSGYRKHYGMGDVGESGGSLI